jgi:integrase
VPRANRGVTLARNDRGIYEIRWTEAGRSRRVSTRTEDPAAAAAFLAEWRKEVARETDTRGAATITGVLDGYFREHVYAHVVGTGTAEIARRHLQEHFGPMAPPDIRKADVRAYIAARAAGQIGQPAQSGTVRRELGVLKAALNHAVSENRLSRGEVPAITLPPDSAPRERWLDDDEVARLFAAAAAFRPDGRLSRVERWLHLAYYTGRRRAAIEHLTWDRVDWALGRIDFDEPGRKRTKKRRGVAHMHPKLRECLERAKREAGDQAVHVLDHPGSVRKTFESLCKRAGLEGVTPHVMKHTCATHMLRRGVSIWDVAGALETTPATIQRVYGKHVPEAARRAMEVL